MKAIFTDTNLVFSSFLPRSTPIHSSEISPGEISFKNKDFTIMPS